MIPHENDWRPFAENFVRELVEHTPEQAVAITRSKTEDRVTTNFFNCDYEALWILIGHLVEDIVMQIIGTNAEEVRELLEGEAE